MITKRNISVLFFCCCFLLIEARLKTAEVVFYSENIALYYPEEIQLPGLLMVEDISLKQFYEDLEKTDYTKVLDQLLQFRTEFGLNDWLYFELLEASMNKIYELEGPIKAQASLWFFLTKSGFDTRLSYHNDKIYLYAWSEEDVFDTPMIMDKEKRFINLSSIKDKGTNPSELKLLLFRPGSEGVSFSFELSTLPKLNPQKKKREVQFKVNERAYKLDFELDLTICKVMENYPSIAEQAYFDIPMSLTAQQTLIPKLTFMVKDKPIQEALGVLVGFTRTAFQYKDDQDVFGTSKPMMAEELFYYQYSDCEDRSALFYYLVKEILNLPLAVIAYPDHLSVAVASDQIRGQAFHFEGLNYFICDPTGPAGSNIIGVPPHGYEDKSFEVLKVSKSTHQK